jgi:hypothetical protein
MDTAIPLMRGSTLLGTLSACETDMPWFICKFEATPDFEAVRPVFSEFARLRREARTRGAAVEMDVREAQSRIFALGLTLVIDGTPDSDFLIYIDDDTAGIRYDVKKHMQDGWLWDEVAKLLGSDPMSRGTGN